MGRLIDTPLPHVYSRRFRMPFPEGFGKAKYGGVGRPREGHGKVPGRSREGPGKVPGRSSGRSAEGRLKVG